MDNKPYFFVSYSRKDMAFVEKLRKDLTSSLFDLWIDLEQMSPSIFIDARLREAIGECKAILLIASPKIITSNFVMGEIILGESLRKDVIPIWADGDEWPQSIFLHLTGKNYIDARKNRYQRAIRELCDYLESLSAPESDPMTQIIESNLAHDAHEWEQNAHNRSYLYVGIKLRKAWEWWMEHAVPDTTVKEFLTACTEAEMARDARYGLLAQLMHNLANQPSFLMNSPGTADFDDYDKTMLSILESALTLTSSEDIGALYLYTNDYNARIYRGEFVNGKFVPSKEDLEIKAYVEGGTPRVKGGIVDYAARTRQTYRTNDTARAKDRNGEKIFIGDPDKIGSEIAVPLILDTGLGKDAARERLIGVLNVEAHEKDAYTENDVRALELFAAQTILAIRRVRHNLMFTVVSEVSKVVSTMLNEDALFQQVVDTICEKFELHYTGLFLVDPTGEYAVLRAGRGQVGEEMIAEGYKLKVGGDSMIGQAIATRKPRIAQDVSKYKEKRQKNPRLPETRSELSLPMILHGKAIGAITIQSKRLSVFLLEDMPALAAMGTQLAIAIENSRVYAQNARAYDQMQTLTEVGTRLSRITRPDKLEDAYDIILEVASEYSQGEVLIRRENPQTKALELARLGKRRFSRKPRQAYAYREGLNGQAAALLETVVVHDLNDLPIDVTQPMPYDPKIRSIVVVPIKFDLLYFGNLNINHERANIFREVDIRFFEGLAQHLGITIHRLNSRP